MTAPAPVALLEVARDVAPIRLADLTAPQRRLVLALITAKKAADAASNPESGTPSDMNMVAPDPDVARVTAQHREGPRTRSQRGAR
jgi:hypothetical protein